MSNLRKKLAKTLSISTGIPVDMAVKFINTTLQEITNLTKQSSKLNIKNFGTFKYKTLPERKVMNLKTMTKMTMQEHQTITFKSSKKLHKYINDN